MPNISKKGNIIFGITNKKTSSFVIIKFKKKGKKVYHLNIGQPDIESPEVALKQLIIFLKKL